MEPLEKIELNGRSGTSEAVEHFRGSTSGISRRDNWAEKTSSMLDVLCPTYTLRAT
jgi:hypothetical protein